MAQITIYNQLKGRLETIDIKFTDKNTTWFDDCVNDHDIHMITDAYGGMLISEYGFDYPILVYGKSRADIDYSKLNALELKGLYIENP